MGMQEKSMPEKNVYEVVMPKLGLIMTEAKLVEWRLKDGEWIEAGEVLFALESDKSTIEIEAPASGYVQILIEAGETVPVMTPVAFIQAEAGELLEQPAGQDKTLDDIQTAVRAVPDDPGRETLPRVAQIRASPKARALAKARGISLHGIGGSGVRDMIVAADLEGLAVPASPVKATPVARRLAADYGLALTEIAGTGSGGRITREDVLNAHTALAEIPAAAPVSASPQPLTGLRAIIAERLSAGWQERPQVTLVTEVDATNLVSARGQFNAEIERKISYNAFIVLAAARALREHPHVNVRLTESGMITLDEIHVGIAVDTERGLMVPVIRNADRKSLLEIETQIHELALRALEGKSLPDELTGGTFTVTNLGVYGVDAFTPIINPPEAAILGVGRLAPRPFTVGRELMVRDTVSLSLSFDHRLIDGAPAAQFLQRIATLIQRPMALVSY
jgi:pyruvate dehydrogenase E2 component (dihydrolipoamide acetyltransferase)